MRDMKNPVSLYWSLFSEIEMLPAAVLRTY